MTRHRRPRPVPKPLAEYPDPMMFPEVAEYLRCSEAHARRLEADGLRVVRWGGGSRVARIYHEDLLAYVEAKRGVKQ